MKNPIQGLVHITGEPDTGKTTFALATGFAPQEICFFDDDLKTQAIANMLAEQGTPLGAYYNLAKLSLGKREIDFHNLVMELVEKQPKGKFKVLVFDTWTRFENTFQPMVQSNPTRFKQFFSPMGSIKGAEVWKASFDYEMAIIDKLLEVAPLVILITHLKDQTVGATKTGKQIPDCKKPVVEKSRLRLWIRHNPDSPQPIGLVLKRLGKAKVSASGIEVVNVLPRKLNPCTWEKIIEYWENPIGNVAPAPSEMPNEFELSILDGVLTEDQKDILHVNRITLDKEQEEEKKAKKAITIDELLSAYPAEDILAANNGNIPASQDEINAAWDALSQK